MTDSSDDYRDELPEDLQPSAFVGAYAFPDNKRRRVPGAIYLAVGLVLVALVLARGTGAVFVNRGFLIAGVSLVVIGLYHLVAGWPLKIDATDALAAAAREAGFAIGHSSAQLGWRGLVSRPTWRLLLYSAEEPPLHRGLVMVDGVDGSIVGSYIEDNPEDWSEYMAR
ncbi:MAG TPA: hypothetical protein VHN98_04160 [Acidimicrobiales bacterium]|nr:hypothetical protein [Acidimicrobiales bacterium]